MIQRIVISIVLIFGSAFAAAEKSRPMEDMHGDCSNYKTDVKTAFAIWGQQVASVSNRKGPLPLEKHLSLELFDQSSVVFVQEPAKVFPIKGKRYAGLFSLRPEKKGFISVASGSRVWFDLIESSSKKIVEADEFEMQTRCDKFVKIVRFPVAAKTNYTFQVSSSPSPRADFAFVAN